jgi:hypothetical protein
VRRHLAALAVAAVATLAAPASAATLIVNGSFETNPGTASTSGANFATMPTGPGTNWSVWSNLPGWTGGSNGIEVQTNPTLGTIDAFHGNYYVELDAHRNTSISQTLNLDVGTYLFSFRYSPRTNDVGTNGVGFKLASATETAFDATAFGPNPRLGFAVGTWSLIERQFQITTAGPFTLTLTGLGTSEGLGALVDDVSMVSVVPLPAGVVFLLTGLGALGLARRAKKSA